MGWSCSAAAGRTMDRVNKAHTEKGCIVLNESRFFVDWSSKEFSDGSIIGTLLEMLEGGRARTCGKIRIDGATGRAVIGTVWLVALANGEVEVSQISEIRKAVEGATR